VAKRRVKYVQRVLDNVGIENGRIEMVNLSSAMGVQFAELARELTERIRRLGPNPLRLAPRTVGQGVASGESDPSGLEPDLNL
jgi:coenzyme F420-reducing hydrogenase delta subunit